METTLFSPCFMLLYLGICLDMDMKDQTEAKSTFVVDPLDPFWTVNKNSALSDSQRYNERKFSLRLSSWMKINYRLGNDNLLTIENFQR
jgi:hypothetical protein